ncbi:MAG TPA: RES family NAD+ phosphorylase [Pricia sp.]|nr:RES family NAD+ phosphorylase [Pricia sp.]
MLVYRIPRAKYADGLQASGRENRWNQAKQYVIYASQSKALATLEMVANRGAIMEGALYRLLTLEISRPGEILTVVRTQELGNRWQNMENRPTTQEIGSRWYIEKSSVALKVPSVLVNGEYNFVINTDHPDFDKRVALKSVEDFYWDARLL